MALPPMKKIQLPERAKKFFVPGTLVLAALLIVGGLYFRQRSLLFSSKVSTGEEEGAVSGVQTSPSPELYPNFPRDIPLFAPAEILSSMESQGGIQVTFQTEASTENVRQFYQLEMGKRGWRLGEGSSGADNGVLLFQKGERRAKLEITSGPAGPTLIVLSTSP